MKYQGQCLCGAIRYELDALSERMGHCHCSMCRKFHGAAFATFGEVRHEDFRWVQGESDLKAYIAKNGSTRQFCQHCGSSMTFKPKNDDGSVIEIALGTLDTPIPNRPDAHIFTANRASWYSIEDSLPQFPASRNSTPLSEV